MTDPEPALANQERRLGVAIASAMKLSAWHIVVIKKANRFIRQEYKTK